MRVYLVKSDKSESGTIEILPKFKQLQFIEDNDLTNLKTGLDIDLMQ